MTKRTPAQEAVRQRRQNAERQAIRLPIRTCEPCGTPHLTKDGHQACAHHISGGYDRPDEKGRGCRNNPIGGTTLCRKHGAMTPNIREAGKRRLAEVKAAAMAARWSLQIDISPTEAILEQVRTSAGHVAFYRLQVEALTHNAMVWGQTRRKIGGDDRGTTHEAGRNAWLKLYDEERERLVKFSGEAVRAGVELRMVRLAEQQGALVADVIRRVLGDLNLTAKQQAAVGEIVPRHLRLLTSNA